MMKYLIFIFTTLILFGCSSSDVDFRPIGESGGENNKIETSISRGFSNSTMMRISSFIPSEMDSAYFFIRIDGNLVEGSESAKKYYPQKENGTAYQGELNRGVIKTAGVNWKSGEKESRYLFSSNGSALSDLLIEVPNVHDLVGENLEYDSLTMKVIWYVAKYTYSHWHVDGIIAPRDKESVDDIELPDSIVGDRISVSFSPGISEDLVCKADDFLIRIDGVYVDSLVVKDDNTVENSNVLISSNGFSVTLDKINNIEPGKEYTYEVWFWINYEEYLKLPETDRIGEIEGNEIYDSNRYEVRSNIYKGIGGHLDTPYIKVSIHVTKK